MGPTTQKRVRDPSRLTLIATRYKFNKLFICLNIILA